MTNTSSFHGLETCIYAFKSQIKRTSDVLVLFVHWYLVKNDFVCIVDGKVIQNIVNSN